MILQEKPMVEHLGHGCTVCGDRLHLRPGSAGVGSASAAAVGHSPGGSGHRAGAVARCVSTRLETPFRVGVRVAHWLRASCSEKGRRVRRRQEAARRFHGKSERSSDFLCLPDLEDFLFCLRKKRNRDQRFWSKFSQKNYNNLKKREISEV